jgi:hypothetical protein
LRLWSVQWHIRFAPGAPSKEPSAMTIDRITTPVRLRHDLAMHCAFGTGRCQKQPQVAMGLEVRVSLDVDNRDGP